jgi:phage terminase large subunit
MEQIKFASEKQKEFVVAGPEDILLFLGGFGSGKTYAGILKMLLLLDKYPNSRGAIVRKQFGQLQKTTLQTLFAVLPSAGYTRRNEQFVDLRNGSRLYFLHLDTDDSLNVLRGLELSFVFVDQLEEIDEDAWDLLEARVGRWSHAKRVGGWPANWKHRDASGKELPPRYMFASANSPGFESWVYRRWAPESTEHDHWKGLGYKVLINSSRENAFLGQANLDTMLSKGAEWVRRWVDACWGEVEGQLHAVHPLSLIIPTPELIAQIKDTHRKFRALDHGDTSPTCCLWGSSDREGNIFVTKEYYKADTLISKHRENISFLSKGDFYDFSVADPSIFFKTAQKHGGKWSVADEYSDVNFLPLQTALFFKAADNNELGTRNRINEYLAVDPEHVHPITKEKGSPRVFFLIRTSDHPMGCFELLKEIRAQKREKVAEGVYSDKRDDSVVDHSYDAFRYMVAARPSVARQPRQDKYNVNTFMGYSNFSKREKERRLRVNSTRGNQGNY